MPAQFDCLSNNLNVLVCCSFMLCSDRFSVFLPLLPAKCWAMSASTTFPVHILQLSIWLHVTYLTQETVLHIKAWGVQFCLYFVIM